MNATRRDPMGGLLDETVTFANPSSSNSPEHVGSSPPASTDRGPHRYVYSSGARPLEGYTIKRAIGRGGFGEVYYAVSDAGKEVALKLVTRNLEIERRGVLHCMNLKNPHLITIFDLKNSEEGDTFVIMEYVSGPSLASILAQHPQGLPLPEVRAWLKGLVEGVAYLHEHGIVHRDLKPANLFLEDGVVKIGDYGLSKSVAASNEAAMSENVGTCHYMAPEISRGKYYKPIDIYATGVILYEMLTGTLPFEGETAQEVLWKHLTDQPDLSKVPEPYRATLRRALAKDPNHRPQHPHELLTPEDAPTPEPIRFLDRQPTAAGFDPVVSRDPEPSAPREDVLIIRDDDPPVMYIGPDTNPPRAQRATYRPQAAPRPAQGRAAWVDTRQIARDHRRQAREARLRAREARRQARLAAIERRRRERLAAAVPPIQFEPPPLPSGRMRVAELAGSMFVSAPLAALGSAIVLPFYSPLGINLPQDPLQLTYLFLMVLLGTWSVLVTTKSWEGRAVARSTRRLCLMGVGLGLGICGVLLGDWSHLAPSPVDQARDQVAFVWAGYQPGQPVLDLGFITYLGLVFALTGWWNLTARDRSARFMFWPIIRAGLIAGVLGLVWPSPQPWATVMVILVAALTELVSPWNREAAAVRYHRAA